MWLARYRCKFRSNSLDVFKLSHSSTNEATRFSSISAIVLQMDYKLRQLRNLHTNLELLNAILFTSLESKTFKTFSDACLECVETLIARVADNTMANKTKNLEQIESIQRYTKIMLYWRQNIIIPSSTRLSFKTTLFFY